MWLRTKSLEKSKSRPTTIELSFNKGDIIAINNKKMSPSKNITLFKYLSWLIMALEEMILLKIDM